MKNNVGNKNTKHGGWNAPQIGVFGALLTVLLASAGTLAQAAPQQSGVLPEQQKRIEVLKAKGLKASLTLLPVRLGGRYWERVSEFVGSLLEEQGLKHVELGKAEFKPGDKIDLEHLAGSLSEFIKKNPITTDYALYTEYNSAGSDKLDELRAVVVDKTGALVWADRQTPEDEAFKRLKAENAIAMSSLLVERLSPLWGLNEQTKKTAKPGKIAAMIAARSAVPPESETAPMPGRQKEMKQAMSKATLVVFAPRVRVADKAAEAAGAADLTKAINHAGLCKAAPAKESLLLKASQEGTNELKVMWDLAREFRDYVNKNPTDADYVLYADYRFNPKHWQAGFVHLIVCDRKGEWVLADLANSDQPDYQSIKPTSRKDCDKLLVKRLKSCLK